MSSNRPRRCRPAPQAPTEAQRIAALETATDGLPDPDTIFSIERPTMGFGSGSEPDWTFTGDGATATFNRPSCSHPDHHFPEMMRAN